MISRPAAARPLGLDLVPVLLALAHLCGAACGQGAVTGHLFFDSDRDAVENGSDYPIAGITVNLVDPGADGYLGTPDDVVVASAVSDSQGDYSFTSVGTGRYFVDVDELDPDLPTTQFGPNLTTANDPQELMVGLGSVSAGPVGWVTGANHCYAVADAGDALHVMDRSDGTNFTIGGCGVPDIEATAIQPGTAVLFAADADTLGTINRITGAFTAVAGTFGTATGLVSGVSTNVALTDCDSLAFDPDPLSATNGVLFGAHRRTSAPDLLFQIDTTTGTFIPGVFPGGYDFAEVVGPAVQGDIDDIAIDIVGGQMYGVANTGGGTDDLIIIDKTTGVASVIGRFDLNGTGTYISDMEGLGFAVDGFFYGTTGNSAGAYSDSMWFVNTLNGYTTLVGHFDTDGDYESMDCLVYGFDNEITGTVFLDNDSDAFLGAGDAGFGGAIVRLLLDTNGNGVVDPGEPLLATQSTDAAGTYSFMVQRTGPFVLEVTPASLPAGHTFTTDNVEVASFNGFGFVDRHNDFGFFVANPSPLQITKGSDAAPNAVSLGQVITYTIQVTNPSPTPQTNVTVTDLLPAGTTYVPGSTTVSAPVSLNGNYHDDFSDQDYCDQDGSLPWTGCWSEDGSDDGSPTGGAVRGTTRIEFRDPGGVERRLWRELGLAGATAANLCYDYDRRGGSGGTLFVEASDDGGATWVTMRTLDLATNDASFCDNLLAFIAPVANARIRFRRNNVGDRSIRIDNVDVAATGTGFSMFAGGAPPLLLTPAINAVTLGAGQTLSITVQVTVDDPIDPALSAIDNTAAASSTQNPLPVTAEHSDPIVCRLGDLVWNDLDFDGVVDPGEPGIGGVTVNLFGAGVDGVLGTPDDVLVGTQITGQLGGYFFTDLAPESYRVDVDETTMPAGTWRLTSAGDPIDVVLTSGEHFVDADFGYEQLGSIGDLVWRDLDGDGVRDLSEPGIASVPVTLFGPGADGLLGTIDDIALETQLTDGFGGYRFMLLRPGDYRVAVNDNSAPLAGFGLTTGNDPLDLALSSGVDYDLADFGYRTETSTGSIGDRIWNDLDGDGIQDPGEPGLDGLVVELIDAGPDGVFGSPDDVSVGTAVTAGGGVYSFPGLPAGHYQLAVDPASVPGGFAATTAQPLTITLSEGQPYVDGDFGYTADPLTASIGDRVWRDLNANSGFDAGEAGIDGVTVDLVGAGPDGLFLTGDDTFSSTTTAGGGFYSFTGLPAGLYLVDVDDGSGALAGLSLTTGNDPMSVNLLAGQAFDEADFGYDTTVTASIGDFVWHDLNGDGIQDPGEPGLGGVSIELVAPGADGFFGTGDDVVLASTVTDGAGGYLFSGLAPGSYRVDVVDGSVPAGFALTTGAEPIARILSNGEAYRQADFGYQDPLSGSIGDLVWRDLDGDGTFDAGEPPLAGVTVRLRGPGSDGVLGTLDDTLVGTQVTDIAGAYHFTGLAGGSYRIEIDSASPVLAGLGSTTGNEPLAIVLAAGQDYPDADFGYTVDPADASIGDFIWNDLDRDGVQDPGEPGLDGVTVQLFDAGADGVMGTPDDSLVATTVTAGGGAYTFPGLPAGSYRVAVVAASPPLAGLATTTGSALTVTLAVSQAFIGADFGYAIDPGTASIGDFIWHDLDGDGVQDVGEPGIDGVTVILVGAGPDGLFSTGDDTTTPTVTAAGGAYTFAGLPAGLYRVDVDDMSAPLGGLGSTTANDPMVIDLAGGQVVVDADFGYTTETSTGVIGDLVWNDADGDGIRDPAEDGIPGVTVELLGPGADGLLGTPDDIVIATAVTDAVGAYRFADLPSGQYLVDVDEATLPPALATLSTGNEPFQHVLAVGEVFLAADFGYRDPLSGSIGDRVWSDTNGDGVQDVGEPGLAAVTVRLLTAGGDGVLGTADDVIAGTVLTGADGAYQFANLPAGDYLVDVIGSSPPLAGLGITTGNDPLVVSLSPGNVFDGADFGYVTDTSSGSIGDLVWSDANGNGVQDPGELGIDGVTVNLVVAGPDGLLGTADDVTIASTTTAGGGAYSFAGLTAGRYVVDIDGTSPALAGLAPTTAEPQVVLLSVGEAYIDADFGYDTDPGTGSIGDLVWLDLDGDGMLDPGEPGIDGVTVVLLGAGADGVFGTGDDISPAPAVTSGGGGYAFTGLPAGRYRVDVDAASAPLAGLGITTGNDPFELVLGAGEAFADADFGWRTETRLGSVGDLVWDDLDRDGFRDPGEPPLAGILLVLWGAGADGLIGTGDDAALGVTETDAAGLYAFLELPAGDYRVDVVETTLPPNYVLTSGNEPMTINLAEGQVFADADFGYHDSRRASVGDTVYYDADGDGIQDAGENGIANVVVELYRDGVPTGSTRVTGGGGTYRFDYLPAGDYTVVVLPQNFSAGGALQATSSTTGGDVHGPNTVLSGQTYLNADFGYLGAGFSIGDFVWSDADNDGFQDPGEVGIPGVQLELWQQGNPAPVATTSTSLTGGYLFSSLPAGVYAVVVAASNFAPGAPLDGFVVTVGPQSVGTDHSGNFGIDAMRPSVDVVDFGYFRAGLGSIGDTVFLDRDLDGSQGGGESGIPGVTVDLFLDLDGDGIVDAGEPVVASAITDASGQYSFTGLAAGDYLVSVTDTGGVLSVLTQTTGNDPQAVALAAGQSFLDADFGYGAIGLGDLVWFDTDGDGVQGASETGISGVQLELYRDLDGDGVIDPEDSLVRTTTTGFGGSYLFDQLADGDYIVSVPAAQFAAGAPLAGMIASPAAAGGDATADSNGAMDGSGNITAAVAVSGGTNIDLDFGFNAGVGLSIGDFLWLDLDRDGVQDGGEPGIAGVTLELFRDLDGDGILDPEDVQLATTMSDGGGGYDFAGLPQGDYIVVISDDFGVLTGLEQTFGSPVTPIMNLVASLADIDFGFADERPLYAVVASAGGVHDGRDALVIWETASEVDTAGFFLYRLTGVATWNRVQPDMIPAVAHGLAGARYWCVDPTAALGVASTYKLEEVELDGSRRFHSAFEASFKPVPAYLRSAGTSGGARRVAAPVAAATTRDRASVQATRAAATGERLKVLVSRDGIYRIGVQEIATRMAVDVDDARLWMATGGLRLENRGRVVPYNADMSGESLAFHGVALGDDSTYGDENVYWLSRGVGKTMDEDLGAGPAGTADVSSFTAVAHAEESTYFQAPVHRSVDPLLDYWFWDLVVAGVPPLASKTLDVEVLDLAPEGAEANLYVLLKGSGEGPHHVQLSVGGQQVGETTWVGERVHEFGVAFAHSLLVEGDNEVTFGAVLERDGFDIAFIDSIDITYERRLRARDGALQVSGLASDAVTIRGFSDPQIDVYDITDPARPQLVANALWIDAAGYSATFTSDGEARTYLAVTPAGELTPDAVWADTPSSLLDASNRADYLVIAPAELLGPATRLADHRAAGGHEAMVVQLEDVYDEFRHGLQDPTAIADLLRHAADHWRVAPRYVVLAGDGHYDYRDHLGRGGNLIPPVLVATVHGLYPSDSVLAGRDRNWQHAAERAIIGRIPATSAAHMDALVDKIIAYEATPSGAWSNRAILLADNADEGGSYAARSDEVATELPTWFATTRVYLDEHTPAQARQLLASELGQGAGILNYFGHAGLLQLADENLLNIPGVTALAPTTQLPVVTGVSCLLGHFAVPGFPSVGEALVARADGGAIAAWLSASLTIVSQGQGVDAAFLRARGKTSVLGDMIRLATAELRRTGRSTQFLETTILLGDPGLELR